MAGDGRDERLENGKAKRFCGVREEEEKPLSRTWSDT
jgi:hypothetical protein